MRWLLKGKFKLFHEQTGFTLIEVMFAVGILALIGVTFMTSLSTAYKSVGVLDEQTQAEALVRSQLEDIKDSLYQDSGNYTVTVNLPTQYSLFINVQTIDTPTCATDGNCNTLQEIKVSVSRPTGEGGDRPVFSVSTYKAKK